MRLRAGLDALRGLADEWDSLAVAGRSPFQSATWLLCWWSAFGRGEPLVAAIEDHAGGLRAAALLARGAHGSLKGAANDHSGDWSPVHADPDAADELWRGFGALGAAEVVLPVLPSDGAAEAAAASLRAAGYRIVRERGPFSPYLSLPETAEALLGSVSRNLRSQLGRRRRALAREGTLALRTVTGGAELEGALDAFLAVEASGWKASSGSAILNDPRAERLYRDFASAAADRGWLRLRLLEIAGRVVAGDLACVFGGGEFLVKTGFDDSWAPFSPGLVLRGEVLRAAIEERLDFYDFLGGPDAYKLRWTDELRARTTVRGYRGVRALPAFAYRSRLRPRLKRARERWHGRRIGRER